MGCVACGRGFHGECPIRINDELCCCTGYSRSLENSLSNESESKDENWRKGSTRGHRGSGKRDESLRDQQSTGRKRAAIQYPLDREAACEWQGLLFAGGGSSPIVGCIDGRQQARHHGPDKNTLNNDEGNVHRICHQDHNRWHTLNDPEYSWGAIYRPHDQQTKATAQDQYEDMKFWSGRKTLVAKDY